MQLNARDHRLLDLCANAILDVQDTGVTLEDAAHAAGHGETGETPLDVVRGQVVDSQVVLTRTREHAFLANTLLAGSSVQSRPFTPREASEAAASVCSLGLECWPAGPPPDTFLVNHDLITAFEVGWSVLYRDVSLFVAGQLISTLADLQCADVDTRRALRTLRRTLVDHRKAGTPWLARDAADVLAVIDMTAWVSVLGLLDECPIMPAALTAILEGRTRSVSPTAFEFVSTAAQLGDIRVFMRMLPGVLSG